MVGFLEIPEHMVETASSISRVLLLFVRLC
jgi:hypothetical protein